MDPLTSKITLTQVILRQIKTKKLPNHMVKVKKVIISMSQMKTSTKIKMYLLN